MVDSLLSVLFGFSSPRFLVDPSAFSHSHSTSASISAVSVGHVLVRLNFFRSMVTVAILAWSPPPLQGKTVVENLLDSDDINYMLAALKELGVAIEKDGETYKIVGNR